MKIESSKNIQAKDFDTEIAFQPVIPGLEEFMAKLNQNTKNTEKTQSK
ncbi:MAG: hypothetical protein U7127_10350 [Phormidium sp.]